MTRKYMDLSTHIAEIYVRDNGICHYCTREVWVKGCHPTGSNSSQASKDHVVPKTYGGINHPDNYVLACVKCNTERHHDINACACDFCEPRISAFKATTAYVDAVLAEMVAFNKPVVKFVRRSWKVYICHKQYRFDTWEQAMKFVALESKTNVEMNLLQDLQKKFEHER